MEKKELQFTIVFPKALANLLPTEINRKTEQFVEGLLKAAGKSGIDEGTIVQYQWKGETEVHQVPIRATA